MSPAQHTPGTWRVQTNRDGLIVVLAGAERICAMSPTADHFAMTDARLIAAAPEMLATLHDTRANLVELLGVLAQGPARSRVAAHLARVGSLIDRVEGRA